MAYDEVGRKATEKYRKKFDLIQIRVEHGERDIICQHAKQQGESINKFINRAIKETIERDQNNPQNE